MVHRVALACQREALCNPSNRRHLLLAQMMGHSPFSNGLQSAVWTGTLDTKGGGQSFAADARAQCFCREADIPK